jgi:SET domain-containing protein
MPSYDSNELCFVADSPLHGRGLFARCNIPAETWVGHYDGPQTTENGIHVLWVETGGSDSKDEENAWTGYDGINELRFLNHARTPNAEMDGLNVYTLDDIAAGEEITINYGEEFDIE